LSLFKWCWATFARARNDWAYYRKISNSRAELKPFELFPQLSQPDSYEFTKVRFMFLVGYDFPHHLLVPLGEKLLSPERNDISMAITLLMLYQPQAYKEDRAKGDRLVTQIDKAIGNEPRALGQTGQYYYRCWLGTKSVADAKQAISRLTKLHDGSKHDDQRQLLKRQIEQIRKGTKGLG
jgi:hypothetical protein